MYHTSVGMTSADYGPGTGNIVWQDLSCFGSEDSLFDCPHEDVDVELCSHGQDVGVTCHGNKNIT